MTIKERARELHREYLQEIHDMSDYTGIDNTALMTFCIIEAIKEAKALNALEGLKNFPRNFPSELGKDAWNVYKEKRDEKRKNGEME
jgi:hypothetical protein